MYIFKQWKCKCVCSICRWFLDRLFSHVPWAAKINRQQFSGELKPSLLGWLTMAPAQYQEKSQTRYWFGIPFWVNFSIALLSHFESLSTMRVWPNMTEHVAVLAVMLSLRAFSKLRLPRQRENMRERDLGWGCPWVPLGPLNLFMLRAYSSAADREGAIRLNPSILIDTHQLISPNPKNQTANLVTMSCASRVLSLGSWWQLMSFMP